MDKKIPLLQEQGLTHHAKDSTVKQKPITADEVVKEAFRNGEWLTDAKAIHTYGCYRFRTLMTELRQSGWLFYDEKQSGQNRYGKTSHWKRYKLIKEGL